METSGFKVADFGVPPVRGIHLSIPFGRCIGLSGPSGSGKTLLLRAMADLDPHEGRMWLDGRAAESMAVHQWRRQVGLLPAESAWWHDTVGPHFEHSVEGWLAELKFPPEVMTWQINRLSSGERQRLALLRLLAYNPRVLLLDEPTANLDAENAFRVERLLEIYRSAHRPVMIWVGHDHAQLHRNCSIIYKIRGDRLVMDRDAVPTIWGTVKAGGEK